jgi:hypothetical protein
MPAVAANGTDGVLGEGTNGVRGVSAAGYPPPPADVGIGALNLYTAPSGAGVWGTNTAAGPGVYGTSKSSTGVVGYGVNGVSGQSSGPGGTGVTGSGTGTGVTGTTIGGTGVSGTTVSGTGVSGSSATGSGVLGKSGSGTGVEGVATDPKGFAGKFTGNVSVSGAISTIGNASFDGTVTAKDVIITGADCAELFDTCVGAILEPGTVVVVDDGGRLRASDREYDTRVGGVISGAGEFRPGIVLDRRLHEDDRACLGLVGKVYCKVDADPAPIAVGDLLTTSARPGFGMKASDPTRAFGAVIGKALRPLTAGQGLIPILVALQ